MRYFINLYFDESEWNQIRWKLGLTTSASISDVLDAIEKQNKELELLARAVCLHERGDIDYIDQEIWEFDIMKKVAEEFK